MTRSRTALLFGTGLLALIALGLAAPADAFPWHGFGKSLDETMRELGLGPDGQPLRNKRGTLSDPARVSNLQEARKLTIDTTAVVVLGEGDWVIAELAQLSSLQSLELVRLGTLSTQSFETIGAFTGLTRLVMQSSPAKASQDYAALAKLPRLETLEIKLCPELDDAGLERISKCPSLETLRLSTCAEISDAGIAQLANARTLITLEISANPLLSAKGIGALKGLPDLERLLLNQCTAVDDDAASALAEFPALRELDLSRTGVGDDGVVALSRLSKLTALHLRGLWQLGERSAQRISGMTALERLDLTGCTRVPASALAGLGALVNLKRLALNECQIDDAVLKAIAPLGLTSLGLAAGLDGSTSLSDQGLAELAGMTSLRELNLARHQISAEILESITGLELERLDLAEARGLDSAAVKALAGIESLVWIDLRKCPGLTEADLSPLREKLGDAALRFEPAPAGQAQEEGAESGEGDASSLEGSSEGEGESADEGTDENEGEGSNENPGESSEGNPAAPSAGE